MSLEKESTQGPLQQYANHRVIYSSLLDSGLVTVIDKEAFTGGHGPLPDGRVGRAGDHTHVCHGHAIDVVGVTPDDQDVQEVIETMN